MAVTQQIYEEAYAAFADCMRDGGASPVEVREVGAVHEFSYAADARRVYDACYVDFSGIDFAWQVANSYDSPTYVKLRGCLTALGVQPGGDAETVWHQVQEAEVDVFACTSAEN
ncbi:hypothetical protein [Microbacterium rhizomatis]|uniref:Uncharacterized protein n=1 Tax=Microbacterium rhizomatis TaxID=1631477 RepID=A0A5J5J3B6_9MICO|nr:hypothetical protein [Microbacterium rhizomatis]KAA9107913.1 hypothetical protein F6B43_10835 [Microbacterium rhizomatis]